MKIVLLSFAFLYSGCLIGQADSLSSGVYEWKKFKIEHTVPGERRQILEGITTHLPYLEIHATTVRPGMAPHAPHKHDDEEMIIVKEGMLKITIEDSSKILGPGSVAVIMPGDMHGFVNAGDSNASYYVIKSKAVASAKRGESGGGSFMINANGLVYKEGPKCGKKQYF
jgi:(S)-ureidoglycine aminohydrolase